MNILTTIFVKIYYYYIDTNNVNKLDCSFKCDVRLLDEAGWYGSEVGECTTAHVEGSHAERSKRVVHKSKRMIMRVDLATVLMVVRKELSMSF